MSCLMKICLYLVYNFWRKKIFLREKDRETERDRETETERDRDRETERVKSHEIIAIYGKTKSIQDDP